MPVLKPDDIKTDSGSDDIGAYRAALLSDTGGLTQFGAFTETLTPGSRSAQLHWHSNEDELVYVLSGTVTCVEGDTRTIMYPGDTATFKAGTPVGHMIENHSDADATYLVIGTRSGDDTVTYPLTGNILTVKDGIKTLRNAAGDVLKTAPYHGA